MDRNPNRAPQGAESDARRDGFALVSALLALVVVGALLVGGFSAASSETRVADSERYAGLAIYAAERGLAEALATVLEPQLEAIPVDSTRTVLTDTLSGSRPANAYSVQVRRMAQNTYLFLSTGSLVRGTRGAATRRVGVLARDRDMTGRFEQALIVFGGLKMKGNVTVSGHDTIPGGWSDCDTLGTKPGIVAKDTSLITENGSPNIYGDPPKEQDPSITTDDFDLFGSVTFDELAEIAKMGPHKYLNSSNAVSGVGPVESGTECVMGRDNWGDPTNETSPCHFYFPLIYSAGDFDFGGTSVGQGILLVEGDLDLSGSARFYGIVIVKGELTVGSGSAQIVGTTLVGSEGNLTNLSTMSGTPTIQYSSCSVQRAQEYNSFLGAAMPVAGRSWFDATAASY